MKIFSILFFCILVFSSCEKDITVKVPKKPPRLVINAILERTKPIEIMVGKSRHILDSIELSIEPYIVKDAVVVIYENGIPYDTLVYQPNYTYKSPQNKSIRDGYTYSVKVSATGFTSVEASAIVPSVSEAPGVTRVKDARVTSYGEHQDEVTVTLNDPTEKNFYLLQIYHADAGFGGSTEYPIYCASTTDKDLEKVGEDPDPLSTDNCYDAGNLIMKDDNFNGRQKQLRFYIESSQLQDYTLPGGGTSKPYVKLSRISEDYFKYIKSYHVYNYSGDNPFAEPVNVFTNVVNGLGIFSIRSTAVTFIQ